jgi:predicted metal-dependent hydrolase
MTLAAHYALAIVATDDIRYSVRRSARARRVRVNVDPVSGEVEVVLPQRGRERDAAAAVMELRSWIDKRVGEARHVRDRVNSRGSNIPYLDELLKLVPEPGRTRAHRKGDRLLVPASDPKPAIERFYRRSARAEVEPRLDAAVAELGTSYKSVRIAAQRTRWGSCSAAGVMSFNWRLLLAPERVLDYVIWHEACHLLVLDHSPRYWSLLESHVADYKEPSAWLRRNGATLVV